MPRPQKAVRGRKGVRARAKAEARAEKVSGAAVLFIDKNLKRYLGGVK